ncbi:SOS response-associated peptidase [Paraburkholderia terrae]|uniref:SOS response-associated peptidase n=1 Tax=Paraburkholderia terrae TaxID=311230 RepID=UPI00296A9FCD|nr:SOS response-associated peptidase family protein [Paraburkholderia terrae]MDW3657990.1 SOS response-associated peptidase family protein [Paraburkholderia terrae]
MMAAEEARMCTSYEANPNDAWDVFSLFPVPDFDYRPEIYKDYYAPVFRRSADEFETVPASFGIVPRRHIRPGRKAYDTMNARSESVADKQSFSDAWKNLQLCLIPCRTFFEPNYETGKPVRWKIGMADGAPLAIAGLWRSWREIDGAHTLAFTMLTVNSDEHPLMNRFHKPGDEKRSVVIVPSANYASWLSCTTIDDARGFLSLFPAEAMRAEPFPLPPRKPKPADDSSGQQSLL